MPLAQGTELEGAQDPKAWPSSAPASPPLTGQRPSHTPGRVHRPVGQACAAGKAGPPAQLWRELWPWSQNVDTLCPFDLIKKPRPQPQGLQEHQGPHPQTPTHGSPCILRPADGRIFLLSDNIMNLFCIPRRAYGSYRHWAGRCRRVTGKWQGPETTDEEERLSPSLLDTSQHVAAEPVSAASPNYTSLSDEEIRHRNTMRAPEHINIYIIIRKIFSSCANPPTTSLTLINSSSEMGQPSETGPWGLLPLTQTISFFLWRKQV